MSVENESRGTSTPNRQPLIQLNTPHHIPSPFSTPHHQKNTPKNCLPSGTLTLSQRWPHLGQRILTKTLESVTKQIFGYSPRSWQTKVAERILEGHDVITVAGTGAGKSLIFAMLAIAAELAGFEGFVVVICPLKSLKKGQVSFCETLQNSHAHRTRNRCDGSQKHMH